MLTKLILWALRSARFSTEDRALFTGELLRRLGAIDLCGIVEADGAKILIRGVPLNQERLIALRESAKAQLTSFARKIVRDLVLEEAHQIGFVAGKDKDSILFARAALWFATREQELYKDLANDTGNSSLNGD